MATQRAGQTENVSVSLPSDLLAVLRERTGRRGVSSYITDAVRHQLEMDGLAEIVAAQEAEHGPLTEAEIEAASRELFGHAGTEGQHAA
ncbi:ribbon-helix-helix domain-containing protein [Streptomyces sp. YIM S03343]